MFDKHYCSESVVDLPRDVSEAFSKDYNNNLKEDVKEGQSVHVVLSFENQKKTICVDKTYDFWELHEVEDSLWEAVSDLKNVVKDIEIDEYGFYPGDIHLVMSLVKE